MNILVRADSGQHIGLGHVMRCLTLSNALIDKGNKVYFVTRQHKNSFNIPKKNNLKVIYLDNGVQELSLVDKDNYSKWAGVSFEQDACEVNALGIYFDLAIIDHYSFDYQYEQQINAKKILVIDDLMNRRHECDYLLDQNLSADQLKYSALCPSKTKFMLGPQYALLRPEFSENRPEFPRHVEIIKKILLFFGGSDITNECRKVVDAYEQCSYTYRLHIILSDKHKDFEYIASKNFVTIYSYVEDMASLYCKVDVCFGAMGSSTWERACLSIPSFIVKIAENQSLIEKSLQSLSLCKYVGDGQKTTSSSWKEALSCLDNISCINNYSKNSFSLCDGNGSEKVCDEVANDFV